MKRIVWRVHWLMAALVLAGLAVGSAGADIPVSYGVSVAKGCSSPTPVGQHFSCEYALGNTFSTSHETVVVTAAKDSANRRPGEGPNTNILPELSLTLSKTASTP